MALADRAAEAVLGEAGELFAQAQGAHL